MLLKRSQNEHKYSHVPATGHPVSFTPGIYHVYQVSYQPGTRCHLVPCKYTSTPGEYVPYVLVYTPIGTYTWNTYWYIHRNCYAHQVVGMYVCIQRQPSIDIPGTPSRKQSPRMQQSTKRKFQESKWMPPVVHTVHIISTSIQKDFHCRSAVAMPAVVRILPGVQCIHNARVPL